MTYDIVHQDWEPLDSNQSMNDMKLAKDITEKEMPLDDYQIFEGKHKLYIQSSSLLDKKTSCYMGIAMRSVVKFENEEDAILCKLIV